MNIRYFQRGPVWWIDVRDGGERKKASTGHTSLEEARKVGPELALRALAALRSPKSSPCADASVNAPKGHTLKGAFKLCMTTREAWIKSRDKESLTNTFNVLADQLGEDFPMEKLNRDFVRNLRSQWLEEPGKRRGTKLSHSTINGRLSMLSVLLEACDLPPHTVKHLSVKGQRRTRRFNQMEIQQMQSWLLANAQRKGALVLHDMITVALVTGARAGELEGLPHGDIDMQSRIVTLRHTKNGTTRRVPFDEACARIFEARRAAPGGPFMELGKSQRSALIREIREALGLEHDEEFVFHILRHEAASRMVAAGIQPLVVQSYMGHSSINTTGIYVHNNDEVLHEALVQRQQYEALRNAPTSGSVQ
ncbi:MAG: tyrosine-type recombinase/integrase [Aquabacterium sp.]